MSGLTLKSIDFYKVSTLMASCFCAALVSMSFAAQCSDAQTDGVSEKSENETRIAQSTQNSSDPQTETPSENTSGNSSAAMPADASQADGQSIEAETEASSANQPLPPAPPPILPESESQPAVPDGIPNADAMTNTPGNFGSADIPGYNEAMKAARTPTQSKGNKQLIESLRDVFPINGNPLKDLFTPQPQYVTPQTLMNPQPAVPKAGEANPLKGLFTPQPQYVTPQTLMNPDPAPPDGEINHLKGVFTAQPQYVTPQTLMNPHALPRYYVKERLPEHFFVKDAGGKDRPTDKIETPLGPAKAADNSVNSNAHPLRQAMLLINSAREGDAIALMDRFLVQYPGNFQARYVKAVALVRLRRFAEARDEYQRIMQYSADPALKTLAQEGMTKLDQ